MKFKRAKTRAELAEVKDLYEEAFPVCEKKPFWLIKHKQRKGLVDIWRIEEGDEFTGLAITMKAKDLVLLDYFAMAEKKRGGGCGSHALKMLQKHYGDKRFFLEIESTYGRAENQADRERRKHFYLRNQMTETGMLVDVFGTEMEVLGYRCILNYEEYVSVYREIYGSIKARGLKKISN